MNKYVTLILAALGLAFATGCTSPTAQAVYAAGYATSSDILDHDATLAPMIKDVGIKLPLLTTGGLTDRDIGILRGQLNILEANTTLLAKLVPKDASALAEAQAFLAGLISSMQTATGGKVPTVNTLVVMQFSQGLNNGIDYWQGKHSVSHP